MSVAVANELLMTDGDAAFLRVNNRVPSHALQPGEVAAATNVRFEQGKPQPRFGVALDEWGAPHPNLLPTEELGALPPGVNYFGGEVALEVGRSYRWKKGNAYALTSDRVAAQVGYAPGPTVIEEGIFEATQVTYYVWYDRSAENSTTTGDIRLAVSTCAYERFNDPVTGTDNGILITDEWRDDDGRGRAWRIYPGNGPQEIPLNGHDVWGTARLVQCRKTLLLLRHGNERHYFGPGDLDALEATIELHCAPSWGVDTSERVRFENATAGAAIYGQSQDITDTDAAADTITVVGHGLANGTAKYITALTGAPAGMYFVRSASADTLSLYDTAAHAIAGGATGLVDLTADDETGTLYDLNPLSGQFYYARRVSGNKIRLFQTAAAAAAETPYLTFSAAHTHVGKFFIEKATSPAPFFGNGAPVLSMQPSELGSTAFEGGFEAVPASVEITDTDTNSITCPNHNFVPGDVVTPVGLTIGTVAPWYAYPIDDDTISIHSDQDDALTGANPINDITADGTGSISKANASGLPLPPCREGAYINGRFWGINERDTVVFSDPNDFLHFTLYQSTLSANQGEAGRANWIRPLGESALLIGKDHKLILLVGIDGETSTWRESVLTSEYGGLAALAATAVGTNIWALSRKGVARAIRTVAGEKLAEAETVSDDIPEDLRDIDWGQAYRACGETWNGRYFLSVPTKGQTEVVNNKTLVFNFRNTGLAVQQEELAGDIIGRIVKTGGNVDSWEGSWNGALLTPYAWCRLTVNGEERLSFATPEGLVCWLHDGWDDVGAAIETELLTRGYFGGREMLALKGKLNWDSFNPSVTASIVTAGVNEEETLAGFDGLEYDRTQYLTDGATDYDPSTSTEEQFSAPRREDYSPTAEELTVATVDTHQNLTEPFRCRERGNAPQLRIANAQGSLRVCSVSLQARPVGVSATRKA